MDDETLYTLMIETEGNDVVVLDPAMKPAVTYYIFNPFGFEDRN